MPLTLKELVANLKSELQEAQDEADEPMFVLDGASIKTRIIAVDKTKEGLGVKFFVVNASIEANQEDTSEHEVTINLKPILDEDGKGIVLGTKK